MARPEGFEPPTSGLEIRCSIRLSYGRVPALNGTRFMAAELYRAAIIVAPYSGRDDAQVEPLPGDFYVRGRH